MKQWLTVAALAAGFAFSACGSSEKKDTTPTAPAFTPAPDNEAIVGSWSDGQSTLTINGNGTYRWDDSIPCGAPPCPVKSTNGAWELRRDKLVLTPSDAEAGADPVAFSFENNQKTVKLSSNKQNRDWTFNKR
jgi:hypothetical protein